MEIVGHVLHFFLKMILYIIDVSVMCRDVKGIFWLIPLNQKLNFQATHSITSPFYWRNISRPLS
jgi:hypothetical protein